MLTLCTALLAVSSARSASFRSRSAVLMAAKKAPALVPAPRVNLLRRIDELKLLTQVAEAGLLSQAEEAGFFSKLEEAGAFSRLEALLPALDKFGALTFAETLVNTPVSSLALGAASLLGAETALILLVPDDNAALIVAQVTAGLVALLGAGALAGVGYAVSIVQGDE